MIIIGVDYHPSFQQIAFMEEETGECGERRLNHSDGEAERFYRELKQRGISVRVGMEATGYSRWFERLLAELGFEVWIGDAAEIKRKRVRKQKTDREDARLMLRLLLENRFPRIWVPNPENRDLRQLLWHRHRLVQMRTRIMNQLQAVAMNEGYGWKKKLFSEKGRAQLEKLSLAPWASRRRKELLELLDQLNPKTAELTAAVEQEANKRPEVVQLMTHPGVGPIRSVAAIQTRKVFDPSMFVSSLTEVPIYWQSSVDTYVYWLFVKIPAAVRTDLTSSLIGVLIFSLPTLAARLRRGEKYPSTLRRTPASASASWTPQKSTSRLVLWL
jgi:transposase